MNYELPNSKKLVKSVVRTIDLLVLLMKSDKYLTLQEISSMLELPKSSTFELVQTMLYKGIVEYKSEDHKSYGLSMLAYEIGSSVVDRLAVTNIARPYIQELNRLTGGTAFLGVEDHGQIVYIDRAEDHSIVKASAKLGSRRNLNTTSLGKAILYAHSNDQILTILGPEPYSTQTPLSHTTSVQVLTDAKISRKRGYAIDDREDGPDMFCIGSAIRDRSGEAVASISVASIYSMLNERKKELIAKHVVDTAMEISQKLGFTGDRIYKNEQDWRFKKDE